MTVLRVVAGQEVFEVGAAQRVFLQREVLVGAQIVDPHALGPRFFAGRFSVEEDDIRLHALGVEEPSGQAQDGVDIGLFEQVTTDGFARAALEKHIIRKHDGRASVLLQDGEDVLDEVELFVARARPEVVAVDDQAFLRGFALVVHDGHAALFTEGRVGEDDVVLAVFGRERVERAHRQVLVGIAADAVQEHVHRAQARDGRHQLHAVEGAGAQRLFLRLVEAGQACEVIVCREQESARAARGVADGLPGLRIHGLHDGRDERARREVLARAALHILGVLLQQTLVGVALNIGVEARPLLLVDEVDDEPTQLRWVLDFVLRLFENQPEHAAAAAEGFQRVTVVNLQVVALEFQQGGPIEPFRNGGRPVERWPALHIHHFKEKQESQLLNIVAVRQPVVAQDVAVVPEFLNEGGGSGHLKGDG